jgi:hypothetical protein
VVSVKVDKRRARTPRPGGARRTVGRAAATIGIAIAMVSVGGPAQAAVPATKVMIDYEVHELTPAFSARLKALPVARRGLTQCGVVKLTNQYNGKIVAAELDNTGASYAMLRARSNAFGNWERFEYCHYSEGYVTIRSLSNGRFVSAEMDYTGTNYGMLRARAGSVGPWERFTEVFSGGSWGFRAHANNRWVRAEVGFSGSANGMLRASVVLSSIPGDSACRFQRTYMS